MVRNFPAMKLGITILLSLCTIGLAQEAASSKVPDVPGWFLTWHDEFDGTTVDLSKWTPDDRNLHKNNELQHYRPDDVIVKDGILTLRSQIREFQGQPYTSGLIDSRGKFYQTYGRFESRMKVPKGKGLWPAFWLLPEDATWPPEIDIMEFLGHIGNVVHMTLHSPGGPGGRTTQHKDFFGPFFPKDYHTFAVEWEPEEMRFYVDGKQRAAYKEHLPDKPHFIIFNMAVGGDWPGNPDDPKVFPAKFEIDYVRVWQKEIPGSWILSAWGEHGRVAVDPPQERFKNGEKVVMLAHPDLGYKFDRWSGDLEGNENPVQGVMQRNMRVVAHFVPDPESVAKSKLSLSLNKPSESSSDENSVFQSANAFDGKLATRWSSQRRDPQWLSVDLGQRRQIDSVRIVWQDPAGEYFVHSFAPQYSIEVSEDGRSWKKVHETKVGNGGTEEIKLSNASGRYVRLSAASRHTVHGVAVLEFEVFGK